jgi:hypothetical protein
MPFRDFDATALDSYHIKNPDGLLEDTDRLKKILDAKYVPAARPSEALPESGAIAKSATIEATGPTPETFSLV